MVLRICNKSNYYIEFFPMIQATFSSILSWALIDELKFKTRINNQSSSLIQLFISHPRYKNVVIFRS